MFWEFSVQTVLPQVSMWFEYYIIIIIIIIIIVVVVVVVGFLWSIIYSP